MITNYYPTFGWYGKPKNKLPYRHCAPFLHVNFPEIISNLRRALEYFWYCRHPFYTLENIFIEWLESDCFQGAQFAIVGLFTFGLTIRDQLLCQTVSGIFILARRTMSLPEKQDNITKEEWMAKLEKNYTQRASMNDLIMNYLVTEGFKEAAEKFQQESGVEPTVDLSSLDNRIRIREAIQNGNIQKATELVNQLHPELLDNDRHLYFRLQQLHLIELIRTGKVEEALQFAQDRLSEAGESNNNILCELERTLALLAFDEPHKSPYSDLLHPTHRQKIASDLNAAILKMEYKESTSPRLNNLLKMILWAQDELDKKKVKYPKMTDLGNATIESPK